MSSKRDEKAGPGKLKLQEEESLVVFAFDVYRQCRDSIGHLTHLSKDVKQIANILLDLEDLVRADEAAGATISGYARLKNDTRLALTELSSLSRKYDAFTLAAKRQWNNVDCTRPYVQNLQERVKDLATGLEDTWRSVEDKKRVEDATRLVVAEYDDRHRSTLLLLLASSAGIGEEREVAWSGLLDDLADLGIAQEWANDQRPLVRDAYVKAVSINLRKNARGPPTTRVVSERPQQAELVQASAVEYQTDPPPEVTPFITDHSTPNGSIALRHHVQQMPQLVQATGQQYQGQEQYEHHQLSQLPQTQQVLSSRHAVPQDLPRPDFGTTPNSQNDTSLRTSQGGSIGTEPPDVVSQLDLTANARKIVRLWNACQWADVGKLLIEHIDAVQSGQTAVVAGTTRAPDTRVLNHLLGVASSFRGDFVEAKRIFDHSFRRHGQNYNWDEGDVAAARWLGDTCLILNELQNAALAYSMALQHLSAISNQALGAWSASPQILGEITALHMKTKGLASLIDNMQRLNLDSSTIFESIDSVTKHRALESTLHEVHSAVKHHVNDTGGARSRAVRGVGIQIGEGFLLQRPLDYQAWPLPYDPHFSVQNAVMLEYSMRGNAHMKGVRELYEVTIPSSPFGSTKDYDWTTKRASDWIFAVLRTGLQIHGIRIYVAPTIILCKWTRHDARITYTEIVGIQFWRLGVTLRSTAIKLVSKLPTRLNCSRSTTNSAALGLVQVVRDILVNAERGVPDHISRRESADDSRNRVRSGHVEAWGNSIQEAPDPESQELSGVAIHQLPS